MIAKEMDRGEHLFNLMYVRVLERMEFASYEEMLAGDGRCVGDFLPRESHLSVAEAATKYREEMTDPKYKSAGKNGREHGAVALRVEAL